MNEVINRRELTYKALAGLGGGAVGWLPVEIASHGHSLTQQMTVGSMIAAYVSMAMLSGMIGGLILASEHQRLEFTPLVRNRFLRGFIVCFVLALPANYYANMIFSGILRYGGWGIAQAGSPLYLFVGRVVSWTMMGAMLGAGVGIASFRPINILKGAAGGWVGGFFGGLIFDPINMATGGGLVSRLLGLSLIGLAIGLLIGIVQELTKSAWLTVEAGRLHGRQFRLEGSVALIGRAEENPVGLFGDPGVQMRHAVIEYREPDYVLRSLAIQDGTFVNGARVETATLKDGDRIKLGGYELTFHLRQSPALRTGKAAPRPASAPQPISPSSPTPAEEAASSRPCLVDGAGTRFPVPADKVTLIGRALDNDIVIAHASVSRHHANIEPQNGAFRLRDLGSQNGTFVAGQRVTEAPLKDGDAVRLGEASFVFRA